MIDRSDRLNNQERVAAPQQLSHAWEAICEVDNRVPGGVVWKTLADYPNGTVLYVIPQGPRAELERVGFAIADAVFNSAGSFLSTDEELLEIVRQVIQDKVLING
jgi:hypothetical protein